MPGDLFEPISEIAKQKKSGRADPAVMARIYSRIYSSRRSPTPKTSSSQSSKTSSSQSSKTSSSQSPKTSSNQSPKTSSNQSPKTSSSQSSKKPTYEDFQKFISIGGRHKNASEEKEAGAPAKDKDSPQSRQEQPKGNIITQAFDFLNKQAKGLLLTYALTQEKEKMMQQEQQRGEAIAKYNEEAHKQLSSGSAIQMPLMFTMTSESRAIYEKEVAEYNEMFQAGLKTGIIKENNGEYILNYYPASSRDVEFVNRLQKEYSDIKIAESTAKYQAQQNVLIPFTKAGAERLGELSSQISPSKAEDIAKIDKLIESNKPLIYFEGFGNWAKGKGVVGGKVMDYIQEQAAKIPETSQVDESVYWEYRKSAGFSPADIVAAEVFGRVGGVGYGSARELMQHAAKWKWYESLGFSPTEDSVKVARVGYGSFRELIQLAAKYPAEGVALYFAGKKLGAPAFSALGTLQASSMTIAPTLVTVGQGVIGAGMVTPLLLESIDLYQSARSHWEFGEYEQIGKEGARLIVPMAVLGAGIGAGKGHGLSKILEQKTVVQLKYNQLAWESAIYKKGGTPEEIASNLMTASRKYEFDFFKKITGRTPKIYYTETHGGVTEIMVKPREPLLPQFQRITYREGGRVIDVDITTGQFQPTKPEVFNLKEDILKLETFKSLSPRLRQIYLEKEVSGAIDLSRVKGWNKLDEVTQKKIMAELSPQDFWTKIGFKKTEVFGGVSSGKPSTGDIDVFTTTSATRFAEALPKSVEITQLTGQAAGSSVVMGGGIKFDIHPYGEKFLFPFWKPGIESEQGIMKTQMSEEFIRRTFGMLESNQRFAKDIEELIRIGKVKGYDVSSAEKGYELIRAEQITYELAKPIPPISAIVASIAAEPSFAYPYLSISDSLSPSLSHKSSYKSPSLPYYSPAISPRISPSLSYKSPYKPYYSPSISPSISPSFSPSLSYKSYYSPSISPSISPSFSPSISPSFQIPFTPLPWSIPMIPTFNLGEGWGIKGIKAKQLFKYQPQLTALFLGIKGKPIKTLTGLEFRPIPIGSNRKRKIKGR